MKINTRKFGDIEIDEKKILTMPDGLPGFPGLTRFAFLEDPRLAPFNWFQSVETPDLALTVIDPILFKPDYDFDIESVIRGKKWAKVTRKDLLVYVVVNIAGEKEGRRVTANLMGPLVLNPKTNQVVQVVLSDSAYSHQHNILAGSEGE